MACMRPVTSITVPSRRSSWYLCTCWLVWVLLMWWGPSVPWHIRGSYATMAVPMHRRYLCCPSGGGAAAAAPAVLLRGAGSAAAGTKSLLQFWAGARADAQHRWVAQHSSVPHGRVHARTVQWLCACHFGMLSAVHPWCKQISLRRWMLLCCCMYHMCRPPLRSSRRMLLDRILRAAQAADKADAATAPQATDQRSRQQSRPSYGPYGNTYPTQGGGSSWGSSNSGSSAWQNAASGSGWGGGWGR